MSKFKILYEFVRVTKTFFQLIWRNVFRSRTTRDCFCAFFYICSFIGKYKNYIYVDIRNAFLYYVDIGNVFLLTVFKYRFKIKI